MRPGWPVLQKQWHTETTPFKKFMTNSRKWKKLRTTLSNVQSETQKLRRQNPNVLRSQSVRWLLFHVIVEFPNSRHTYALRTYFLEWCDERSLERNLEMILPEQLDKVLGRFYASVDGKEIHFNQTTIRVPLQRLIQSTAAASTGQVYNFHNCDEVINQGHARKWG